jgi:hypothetical protein
VSVSDDPSQDDEWLAGTAWRSALDIPLPPPVEADLTLDDDLDEAVDGGLDESSIDGVATTTDDSGLDRDGD